jgi:hypothetical protein
MFARPTSYHKVHRWVWGMLGKLPIIGDTLDGIEQIFEVFGCFRIDINVRHQLAFTAKPEHRRVLQFIHRSLDPKLGQWRIRNETFVQLEITMRDLLFETLKLCINHLALCHCVLPKTEREPSKPTLFHHIARTHSGGLF